MAYLWMCPTCLLGIALGLLFERIDFNFDHDLATRSDSVLSEAVARWVSALVGFGAVPVGGLGVDQIHRSPEFLVRHPLRWDALMGVIWCDASWWDGSFRFGTRFGV